MKALDLAKLSLRHLSGRWAALPATGFAVAAFCLCFAGAILLHVNEAKSMPCELKAVPPENAGVTAALLESVRKLPGVRAATPEYPVEVEIKTGKLRAKLTLAGIEGAYLNEPLRLGSAYPESSVMPHIVLNEAACRQFTEESGDPEGYDAGAAATAAPAVDWLNASFTVITGPDQRAVVSRVCGVLAGYEEGQVPAAYISVGSAMALLKGRSATPESVRIRIENIGYASVVARALTGLGLRAENPDESLQATWDAQLKEAGSLAAIGAFGLICAAALLAAWRRLFLSEQRESLEMLLWLGFRRNDIGSMLLLQALCLSALGAAAGLLACVALPPFLPEEAQGVSVFTLSVPGTVLLAVSGICLLAGTLTGFTRRIDVLTQ